MKRDGYWAPGSPKYKTEAERNEAKLISARKSMAKRRANKEGYAEYQKGYARKKYPELRNAVFDKLGWKCSSCGYDADKRALQIDHKDGNGRRERRQIGWYKYYNKILNDSFNYQILCANCNYIKRYTNSEVYLVDDDLKG